MYIHFLLVFIPKVYMGGRVYIFFVHSLKSATVIDY